MVDSRGREIRIGCAVRIERPMFKNRWGVVKSLEDGYTIIRLNNRDHDSAIAPANIVVLRGPKKDAKNSIPEINRTEPSVPIKKTRRKSL